jgi:hypothetical protein
MNELDMSAPSTELFPEAANQYQDVNMGHSVDDPLSMGVKQNFDGADQGQLSDKEMNFRALRESAAKLKQESEYWRGQAEALKQPQQAQQATQQDAYAALDWEDSQDIRKAFDHLRNENQSLRHEMKDALAAVNTKATRQDWNDMVTEHVPKLTSQNPIFAEMINNASNPYEAAYLLSQLNSRASQPVADQRPNGNAQRIAANAAKPQTIASVGGQSSLSAADYYASMGDEDFMKLAARNMANI